MVLGTKHCPALASFIWTFGKKGSSNNHDTNRISRLWFWGLSSRLHSCWHQPLESSPSQVYASKKVAVQVLPTESTWRDSCDLGHGIFKGSFSIGSKYPSMGNQLAHINHHWSHRLQSVLTICWSHGGNTTTHEWENDVRPVNHERLAMTEAMNPTQIYGIQEYIITICNLFFAWHVYNLSLSCQLCPLGGDIGGPLWLPNAIFSLFAFKYLP